MPIVSKETLKGYFNNGDVPTETEYIDLIDTMGDMSKVVYDTDSDGTVDSAEDADALGGIPASNYLQKTSENRPGVIKLFRSDADSGYYVRHYWTGTHWYLEGYDDNDIFHAGCRVEYANTAPWTGITGKPSTYPPSSHTHGGGDITSQVGDADTVDSLHASQFVRSDADDTKAGDLRSSGGFVAGATTDLAGNGEIVYTSVLKSYKNGVSHTGYVFVPLTTPLTTSLLNISTQSTPTIINNTSWSPNVPEDAKALLIRADVKDSASSNTDVWFGLGPSTTYWYGAVARGYGTPNDTTFEFTSIIITTDGDIYYRNTASGSGTMDVYLQCFGYFI